MRSSSLLSTACLVGLLAGSGSAAAQDLDATGLAGKWQGEIRAVTIRDGIRTEIVVKDDGTFDGWAQRPEGLSVFREGRWKIAGDTETFEYQADIVTASRRRLTTKVPWTLKRSGEDLEGAVLREVDADRSSVTLKRAK